MTTPPPSPSIRKSKTPAIVGAVVAVAAIGGGIWYYLQHTAVRNVDAYLRETVVPQLAAKGATLTYTEVKPAGANSIQIVDAKLVGTSRDGETYELTTPSVVMAVEGRNDISVSLPGPVTSTTDDGAATMSFPSPLEMDITTDGSAQQRVKKAEIIMPSHVETQKAGEVMRMTYDANPTLVFETEDKGGKADISFKNIAFTGEGKALPYARLDSLDLKVKEEQKDQNLRGVSSHFKMDKLVVADEKTEGEPIVALNADNPVSMEADVYMETATTAEQAAQNVSGPLKKFEVKDTRFDYGSKTMLKVNGEAQADETNPMPYGKFTLSVGGYNDVINTISTMGLVEGKDMALFRMVTDKLASYGEMKGDDLELVIAREKDGQPTVGKVSLDQAMQEIMTLVMTGGQGMGEMPSVESRELETPEAPVEEQAD